ncbi:hypothetical protein AB0H57_13150 [Micromonospora sp. NPDC050686]|uniref:hypothetical protein n=1 Tax=Micromonospora sp. NPDC050686 TaxID=3154631 RepID=UPI00340D33E1
MLTFLVAEPPYANGFCYRHRLTAATPPGRQVSVTVRLDAKVKTAICSIPEDAGPGLDYTDAVYGE